MQSDNNDHNGLRATPPTTPQAPTEQGQTRTALDSIATIAPESAEQALYSASWTQPQHSLQRKQSILHAQDLAWYEGSSGATPFYKKELPSPLSWPEPQTRAELEQRLQNIVGRSVAELSQLALLQTPRNISSAKGYVGQLVELFLGAHAHNQSGPDFTQLALELKTMPVGFDLMPQESTFICSADLSPQRLIPFTNSALYHKLRQVLFVLILAPKNLSLALGERRILGYFFFELKDEHLRTVETDYNEFQELLLGGHAQEINGTMGTIVQLRPKATSADEVVKVVDSEGNFNYTKPRGYYLRASFTRELLNTFIQEQGLTEILPKLQNFRQKLNLETAPASDDEEVF